MGLQKWEMSENACNATIVGRASPDRQQYNLAHNEGTTKTFMSCYQNIVYCWSLAR